MRHRSILGAGKTGSISRKQARSAAPRKPNACPLSGSAGTALSVITVFSFQTDENTVSQRIRLEN